MTTERIIDIVAGFYGIKPGEIISQKRTKDLAEARQVVCFLARQEFKESYPSIAKKLGNRDHTTIIYSYKKISKKIEDNEIFKNQIIQMRLYLKNNSPQTKGIIPIKIIDNNNQEEEKKDKKEEKNQLESMFQKILSGQSVIQDLTRQTDILKKYQSGFTFMEIGKIYNLTRERIRQIALKGLLHEASIIFKNGDNLEINKFINNKKSEHWENVKSKHGLVRKVFVKVDKENKWSKYYEHCRKCGTEKIKHTSNGYCKWCYPKSDIFKKMQRESRLRNIGKRKYYTKEYAKKYYKRPEVIDRLKRRIALK